MMKTAKIDRDDRLYSPRSNESMQNDQRFSFPNLDDLSMKGLIYEHINILADNRDQMNDFKNDNEKLKS